MGTEIQQNENGSRKIMELIKKDKSKRIELLDALRGLAIVLMVAHHFLYDAVQFLDAPDRLFHNPVFDALQPFFAGVFICLSGISSNFSSGNLKRGLFTLAVACIVTAVTCTVGMPIIFGVLHLLAVCMMFYGLTQKLWQRLPQGILLILFLVLSFLSQHIVSTVTAESDKLWILGFHTKAFVSYDYFPLLPWFFVFMTGTAIGYFIKAKKFPHWFYNAKIPVLPAIGRYSLFIYLGHQPVLFVITMILQKIICH